jgi:hypothetical protein
MRRMNQLNEDVRTTRPETPRTSIKIASHHLNFPTHHSLPRPVQAEHWMDQDSHARLLPHACTTASEAGASGAFRQKLLLKKHEQQTRLQEGLGLLPMQDIISAPARL